MIRPGFARTSFSRKLHVFLSVFLIFAGPVVPVVTGQVLSWDEAVSGARGQTVDWYMWGGSPAVNAYVNGYLADEVKRRYDITLRQVPVKDIAEVVSKLVVEKQAGKDDGGSVDLMWINGENFRTCLRYGLLYGPFADVLPNQRYVDWTNPTVKNDFGTPVEGMESPWGSAQMVMVYDRARIAEPPRSVGALLEWIQAHPGRFSYPAPPDFTGSVFIRHIFYHVAGSVDRWQGDYTQAELEQAAEKTYLVLRELQPALWRGGSTYPESPVRMDTLFADGELDFSFSYHQGDASRKILDGLFPDTVRTYVFDEGTIANTHFVAIPYNAADKAAAMVVADFLLSPEAQLEKAKPGVWGDFPALSQQKLPPQWQQRFADLPRGPATLDDVELQSHQLPEPPSEILIHLEQGWEQQVLKNR
ncbi:ABC transporter substrate-binding protein [Desulfofustis glycolicus]|uniref:Putative spermidine/putrescine transport system substrate-binding protein n=1 Tax=Desulfofustis glycolicus DSM 9705 TaxID=1121409 RepID=A0A1M5X1M1_9BACT|nr:ABC transporter substrate-binding protein [Desulfofustis glycolicus]SHH93757.1 putative spermidine/putrescine transport system substrate-binding protein [Desulfofustis glycolicus DSM 9705]